MRLAFYWKGSIYHLAPEDDRSGFLTYHSSLGIQVPDDIKLFYWETIACESLDTDNDITFSEENNDEDEDEDDDNGDSSTTESEELVVPNTGTSTGANTGTVDDSLYGL